jgi:hypothetical protein
VNGWFGQFLPGFAGGCFWPVAGQMPLSKYFRT